MNVDVSKRLAECRKRRGYTEASLAEQLDVEERDVKEWENNTKSPTTSELLALSQLYGVSVDELLYGEYAAPEYDEDAASHKTVVMTAKKSAKTVPNTKHIINFRKITWHFLPIAVAVMFFGTVIITGVWNPTWLVLVIIPIYYALILWIRALGRGVDTAVAEFMDSQKEDKR